MSADFNGTGSGHPSSFGDRPDSSNTASTGDGAWILLGGKSFKIAILVLAAVNLAAAVIMMANILYDAWTVRNWDFETRKQWVKPLNALSQYSQSSGVPRSWHIVHQGVGVPKPITPP